MRQLTIEERLVRLEENVNTIREMLEKLLQHQGVQLTKENKREIMNVKQVAQFLGLDLNLIYAKCAKGDIPCFRIGRQYRFRKHEILEWVKMQKELPELSVDDYVDQYLQKNILKS